MTLRSAGLVLVLVTALVTACGESRERGRTDGGGGGVDAPGTDAGSRDGGAGDPAGQCSASRPCTGGAPCMEIRPGIGVCISTPAEAAECSAAGMPPDECCATSDCAEGACYLGPIVPFCGGPGVIPFNVCAVDECTSDADCAGTAAGAVCLPAGAFNRPVRTCIAGACNGDADCTAEPGGRCVLYFDPCCGLPSLQCEYPGGCHTGDDCPGGYCNVRDGRTACEPGAPPCPA